MCPPSAGGRLRRVPIYRQQEWAPDVYPRYNPGPNAVRDCSRALCAGVPAERHGDHPAHELLYWRPGLRALSVQPPESLSACVPRRSNPAPTMIADKTIDENGQSPSGEGARRPMAAAWSLRRQRGTAPPVRGRGD
jgi:hypothetical protein